MHEVYRRVWGLRLRRTDQRLALSPLFMLPSAHYKDVGVRIASFRSSIAHPTYSPVYASLCTSRYPTQNSGPSGSLLLTRKNFHSLLHAGLARRTAIAIYRQLQALSSTIERRSSPLSAIPRSTTKWFRELTMQPRHKPSTHRNGTTLFQPRRKLGNQPWMFNPSGQSGPRLFASGWFWCESRSMKKFFGSARRLSYSSVSS